MGCDNDNFYVLENPMIKDSDAATDFLETGKVIRADAPRCSKCNSAIGMKTWMPPFQVEVQFWGKVCGDLAFFMDDLLVSQPMAECLRNEGIQGIDILSGVSVTRVKPIAMKATMPNYYVGRVTRSAALFDPVASHAEYREMWECPYCLSGELLRHKSVELVRDTWNGEDLFVARGLPGVIITSTRFKEFCDRHKFRNVRLVEAAKFGIDWFPEH